MLVLSDVEFLKWYHHTSEEIRNRVDQLVSEDLLSQGLTDELCADEQEAVCLPLI